MRNKNPFKKTPHSCVYKDGELWNVQCGELKRTTRKSGKAEHLFRVVGEKLPFEALDKVKKDVIEKGHGTKGIYVAHDSMGVPRYIGRGDIFTRLKARKDACELELAYFSFYVVAEKIHEREIETLLIRAAGPLLHFNTRKKRVGILPGNIGDYEAGTYYYERQYKRGR